MHGGELVMAGEVFTQSRLQDYVDCPYRYSLRYIEGIESPSVQAEPVQEYEQAVERGTTFHRLVQQYLLGVSADVIERRIQDDRVRMWWGQFLKEGLSDLPTRRLPEITLTARLGDTAIAAKIDLLALEAGRIVIVDWKTFRKPSIERLETRLQTMVYRWVVSQAAGALLGEPVMPEDIEMRYWFVGDPSPRINLSYSQSKLLSDELELSTLIQKIKRDKEFRRTDDENICRVCGYRSISRPEQQPILTSSMEDDEIYSIGESVASDM
jgi:CRISPR/Cas system-associated exonuclease Cas4 (RecB family)